MPVPRPEAGPQLSRLPSSRMRWRRMGPRRSAWGLHIRQGRGQIGRLHDSMPRGEESAVADEDETRRAETRPSHSRQRLRGSNVSAASPTSVSHREAALAFLPHGQCGEHAAEARIAGRSAPVRQMDERGEEEHAEWKIPHSPRALPRFPRRDTARRKNANRCHQPQCAASPPSRRVPEGNQDAAREIIERAREAAATLDPRAPRQSWIHVLEARASRAGNSGGSMRGRHRQNTPRATRRRSRRRAGP